MDAPLYAPEHKASIERIRLKASRCYLDDLVIVHVNKSSESLRR